MQRSGSRSALREFLESEAAGGVLLIVAAILAMLVANMSAGTNHLYHDLLHAELGPVLTPKLGLKTPHLWMHGMATLACATFMNIGASEARKAPHSS